MAQLFTNNASSTLAAGISVGATSLAVFGGEGVKFPSPVAPDFSLVTLYQKSGTTEINHEIVKVTARIGDALTIERAQEGTTARAFNSGDAVELRWTAKSASDLSVPLLKNVSGTNTITAASSPTLTAQAPTGSLWKLPAAGANTGAVTLNIDGMGAVGVVNNLGAALVAGDIAGANYPCILEKRASDFVLINPAIFHGNVTGTAASASASDVYAWAKAVSKPTYFSSEVCAGDTVDAVGSYTIMMSSTTAAASPWAGNSTYALAGHTGSWRCLTSLVVYSWVTGSGQSAVTHYNHLAVFVRYA